MTSYNLKNIFLDNFPSWLIDKERDYFMDLLRDLIRNICVANTIRITNSEEYYKRRNYQNEAICNCENLLQEMQYIIYVCHPNVERYMKYIDMIEYEITLLKGWRKSDNKIVKDLGYGLNYRVSLLRPTSSMSKATVTATTTPLTPMVFAPDFNSHND